VVSDKSKVQPRLIARVDHLDKRVGDYFAQTNVGQVLANPIQRFKLLGPLIRRFGTFPLHSESAGLEDQEIDDLLGNPELRTEWAKPITELIRDLLPGDGLYSYCAMSYWSPRDRLRHTLSVCGTPPPEQSARILAFAYAFYALTHYGARQEVNLWSIAQYCATHAPLKHPVHVHYSAAEEEHANEDFLRIDPSIADSLFRECGLLEEIEHLTTLDLSELRQLTRSAMWNVDAFWATNAFVQRFADSFRSHLSRLSPESLREASRVLKYMQARFTMTRFNTPKEPDLDLAQAAFMLLTHLMYMQACPTAYIYMTMIRIADWASVVNVGTWAPLTDMQESVLRHIIRSLISVPVAMDYAPGKLQEGLDQFSHEVQKLTTSLCSSSWFKIGDSLEANCLRVATPEGWDPSWRVCPIPEIYQTGADLLNTWIGKGLNAVRFVRDKLQGKPLKSCIRVLAAEACKQHAVQMFLRDKRDQIENMRTRDDVLNIVTRFRQDCDDTLVPIKFENASNLADDNPVWPSANEENPKLDYVVRALLAAFRNACEHVLESNDIDDSEIGVTALLNERNIMLIIKNRATPPRFGDTTHQESVDRHEGTAWVIARCIEAVGGHLTSFKRIEREFRTELRFPLPEEIRYC
jgi:hypothetical protein